jgi:hypothetical protein
MLLRSGAGTVTFGTGAGMFAFGAGAGLLTLGGVRAEVVVRVVPFGEGVTAGLGDSMVLFWARTMG